MAGPDPVQVAHRVLGDDELRSDLADHPRDALPQLEVGLEPTVGLAQEDDVGDADLLGRPGLLLAAQRSHVDPADGAVEPAGVAVGHDAVGDGDAAVGQLGHGAGRAEVHIVGMGGDDQHPLDLGLVDHRARLPRAPLLDRAYHAAMDLERVPLAEIDLSDPELWLAPRARREGAFQTLRDEAPVHFFEEIEFPPFPKGPGYHALTRYEDVWAVSRNPQLFCSGQGANIPDLPIEIAEFFGSMINMDDPRHNRLRSIVAKGFTPKVVSQVDEYVRQKADAIVDGLLERYPDGTCDFVEEVAAPLPLQIICEMMGIPDEDERQVFAWTNTILGAGDPDYGADFGALLEQSVAMNSYAIALGEDRLAHPRDDLTTALMHPEVDGARVTAARVGSHLH